MSRDLGKRNSHDQRLAIGRGLASSRSSEVATVTEAAQARRGWEAMGTRSGGAWQVILKTLGSLGVAGKSLEASEQ